MRIVVEQIGASGDSSGASGFSTSTDSLTSGDAELDALISRAEFLSGFGAAIVGVIEGFNAVKTSALDFAQKIESFAPNIQIANVQRDITMMRSFQSADRMAGKDIGELIKAQANSDAAMVRIESVLNKYGAKIVTPLEELRSFILDEIASRLLWLDQFADENNLIDKGKRIFAPTLTVVDQIVNLIRGNKEEEELKRKAEQVNRGFGAIFKVREANAIPIPSNRPGGPFRVGV